jgi:hypothetical protein
MHFDRSHLRLACGGGVEEEYVADLHVVVSLRLTPAEPAPCRGVVPPMMTSGFVSSLNFGGFEHVKTHPPSLHHILAHPFRVSPPESLIPAISHQHKTGDCAAGRCNMHRTQTKRTAGEIQPLNTMKHTKSRRETVRRSLTGMGRRYGPAP